MPAASNQPDKRSGKAKYPPAPPDAAAVARQIEKIRRQKAHSDGAPAAGPAKGEHHDEAPIAERTGAEQKESPAQNTAGRIDTLRKYRGRRERDVSIGGLISGISRRADRTHKKLGELIGLWEELVPEELAVMTRLTELRGSILHVEVDSSAASYELDRLLRSGTEADLRQRFGGTLTGVRLRIGRPEKT